MSIYNGEMDCQIIIKTSQKQQQILKTGRGWGVSWGVGGGGGYKIL